jgi:hypothetical protein
MLIPLQMLLVLLEKGESLSMGQVMFLIFSVVKKA